MLNTTTKGYSIYTNGICRGDMWRKNGRWHVYQPMRGHSVLKRTIKTLTDAKQWLEISFGGPVELHPVYW